MSHQSLGENSLPWIYREVSEKVCERGPCTLDKTCTRCMTDETDDHTNYRDMVWCESFPFIDGAATKANDPVAWWQAGPMVKVLKRVAVHKPKVEQVSMWSESTLPQAGCMGVAIFAVNSLLASSVGMMAWCVMSYNVEQTVSSDACLGDTAHAEKGGETTFKTMGAESVECFVDSALPCHTIYRFERGMLSACHEGEVKYHRFNQSGRLFQTTGCTTYPTCCKVTDTDGSGEEIAEPSHENGSSCDALDSHDSWLE